jgi:CDP-glycerol glycerophosphotransferase (TagB/SpsB family)
MHSLKKFIKFLGERLFSSRILRFPGGILLYGSGFKSFSSPTKYEYINAIKKGLNAYWIARSFSEYLRLKKQYGLVLLKWTPSYFLRVCQSSEWHISHNISDIFPVKIINVKVINYWHGEPIKYIGYDSDVELEWIQKKLSSGEKLPYDLVDLYLVPSTRLQKRLVSAFRIDSHRVLVKETALTKFLQQHDEFDKSAALFCPTFRISNESDRLNLILESLLVSLNNFHTKVLYIKLHPHTKHWEFECYYERFRAIGVELKPVDRQLDIYSLLPRVGLLITDYSSIIYDSYNALQHDIWLIQFDYDEFVKEHGGLYPVTIPCKVFR